MSRSLRTALLVALCASAALSAAIPPSELNAPILEARADADEAKQSVDVAAAEPEALEERLANLLGIKVAEEKPVDATAFSLAVDVLAPTSISTFQCMRNLGYLVAFTRIYGPSNNGQVDSTGVSNAYNARKANLNYEVFVTPATSSFKSGSTQFTEAYNYATQQGLQLSRVWLQVTSPVNWNTNSYTNINLISNFISAARQKGVNVGIYTNWYDWWQITGATTSIQASDLWYWHTNGFGPRAESSRDFGDFYAFGGFRSPFVKQYGIQELVCSTSVGLSVFPSSRASAAVNTIDETMFLAYQEKH